MRAFVIDASHETLTLGVDAVEPHPAEESDLLVEVHWSGINFKDALVAASPSRVRRVERLVGGVDAAGVLLRDGAGLTAGTPVAVHGFDLGTGRDGGFAEQVYAPARCVSPLPEGLDPRRAMILGTAGLTAVASLQALERHGLTPGGTVLVTGATGGVGSLAVALLSAHGYHPVASTGSLAEEPWLRSLGATQVIGREELSDRPGRVLATERWDGAIDCVGGATLGEILRSLRYGAAVAASGLVGGTDLATTVYPFITRATALVGIDTVEMDPASRQRVWLGAAEFAQRTDLEAHVERVIGLAELPAGLDEVRRGATRGRILVSPLA